MKRTYMRQDMRRKRNDIARDLHTPKYHKRIVKDKKNVYNRQESKRVIRKERIRYANKQEYNDI